MDSIIERLGLYEFFTDLLVGLITLIAFMSFGPVEWFFRLITDTNRLYLSKILDQNEFFSSCIFIIVSYFLGMVVHEIAGLPDKIIDKHIKTPSDRIKKFFLLRTYSRCNFITDKDIIKTGTEQALYSKKIFNDERIAEDKKRVITTAEKKEEEKKQEDYFLKALSYLETNGKDGKIHRIDSLFGMSRSLTCLSIFFVAYFLINGMFLLAFFALASTILFYYKSYWYLNYRTREVLRQYRYLHDDETPR